MAEAIAFYTLSALIIGFAILVITTREAVHSVLFLVLNLLCVAMLYVLLHAQFLAVIQVLVYVGGIVVLYLFVVMLVNLKRPAEANRDPRRRGRLGVVLSALILGELAAIAAWGFAVPSAAAPGPGLRADNVEQIGMLLYTDYLIPFEVASILLLVAMVGAIVLAKREAR
jgi:NADH-quinone oxidoreductase subunit J